MIAELNRLTEKTAKKKEKKRNKFTAFLGKAFGAFTGALMSRVVPRREEDGRYEIRRRRSF
jgi:hypothetical protein